MRKTIHWVGVEGLNKYSKPLKERNQKGKKHEDDKEVKVHVIAYSDTIIDPGAVVIKALNAVTTNGAVAAATCADSAAVSAQTRAVDRGEKPHEFCCLGLKKAGLLERG